MPSKQQTRKCAHPGCQCMVDENSGMGGYCSDYCKNAAEGEYCGCGHTSCNTQFASQPPSRKAA